MRISDWSSDVCSSDLDRTVMPVILRQQIHALPPQGDRAQAAASFRGENRLHEIVEAHQNSPNSSPGAALNNLRRRDRYTGIMLRAAKGKGRGRVLMRTSHSGTIALS